LQRRKTHLPSPNYVPFLYAMLLIKSQRRLNELRKVLPKLILDNQGGFLLKKAIGGQNQCGSRGHLI